MLQAAINSRAAWRLRGNQWQWPWLKSIVLISILAPAVHAANKPDSGAFQGCRETGSGKDISINILKNRSKPVDKPTQMTVNAIIGQAKASGTLRRQQGVAVEGYLIAIRLADPDPANCNDPSLRNYWGWLATNKSDGRSQGIVVVITPRWQAANPKWSLANLQRLAAYGVKFRLTGWLLLDNAHQQDVGKDRATAWAIHPVTKIEILSNNLWSEQ